MAVKKTTHIVTLRKEAKVLGVLRYITEKPCVHGHISERDTKSGKCLECCVEYGREWRSKNQGLGRNHNTAQYQKQWRENNKDRKKETDRSWRINNLGKINARERERRRKNREDKLNLLDKNIRERIVYRRDAKKRGLKFYFTGLPCSDAGHITERIVSSAQCRQCAKEKGVQRHAENREKEKKRSRDRYWGKAREHDLAYAKRHYYENHEVHLSRSKKWSKENPEQVRITRKKSYAKHIDKRRADNRRWMANNPEARRAIKRNRQARKRGNGGTHTALDIVEIYEAQGGRCAYCREKVGDDYNVDHIVALSRGGPNGRRNLQITCPKCNRHKHATDPIDYARSLGMLL